jgi:hypothetical protein
MPGDLLLHQVEHLAVDVFRRDMPAKACVNDNVERFIADHGGFHRIVVFIDYQTSEEGLSHVVPVLFRLAAFDGG